MAKIVYLKFAYEVPDNFNWMNEDPDILDKLIDLVCPINHNEDKETPCKMVMGSGRVMTEEEFDAEMDAEYSE